MTIAAAYLTSEGVAFGADSKTTISDGSGLVGQLLDHAQKIYEVGPPGQGRLAMCTWGAGSVGTLSHRTISARLGDWVKPGTKVDEAAGQLATIANDEHKRANQKVGFGYFIGGWNPVSHEPLCFQVDILAGKPPTIAPLKVGEARFQGAPEMFMRAYFGLDPNIPQFVFQELQKQLAGNAPANLDKMVDAAFGVALNKIPRGGIADMPLREALDFVHMYLHLSIKAFKFRFGPPIVGGPIELGFISTDRSFRWVRHKRFDSAIIQEESGLP